jgi:hypothetical protein
MADIKIKGPQKVLSWGINDGIQDKNQPYFFMYELRWIQRTLAVLIGSLFLPSIAMDTCSMTGRNERME